MKRNEVFPSKYLAQGDLDQNGDTLVTVSSSGFEPVGQDKEKKFVVYFKEIEKGLICNKTNFDRMLDAYETDETDDLDGKAFALYVNADVSYQGKTTGGIRVRAQAPEAPF